MEMIRTFVNDKKSQVVLFSSIAVALYGYDQGMMSLINTNKNYLQTMGIAEEDPLVGVIVSVYYLGCAVGAVLFSRYADYAGRKYGIFTCLSTAALGNLIMFVAGMGYSRGARTIMFLGRIVMGLGVGGVDSIIPVYSSELAEDESRGRALAQEFQMNILGLNVAFVINLGVTQALGKENQWAWRIPIIAMQVFPLLLLAVINLLPESPRWFMFNEKKEEAERSLHFMFEEDEAKEKFKSLEESQKNEEGQNIGYSDMFNPYHPQFHPTVVTIMGQVNQALTGYGAVSVYGPQILELLGFSVQLSEYLTQANYISYFILMTLSWILIDSVGRRKLMIDSSMILTASFLLLTILGAISMNAEALSISVLISGIPGVVVLFLATGAFGIGWLATPWLIPTEIYPTTSRAQGTAVSVIIWGLANFAVTLLTPIMFNNFHYWIFFVFAATNAFAGWWTYVFLPESGGRSFDENQEFFKSAEEEGSWRVSKVAGGEFKKMPSNNQEDDESRPLLSRD